MASHERIKKAYLAAKARHQEGVQKARVIEEEHSARDEQPWPLYAGVFGEYIRRLSRVFPSVNKWEHILKQESKKNEMRPLIMDLAGETHPGILPADEITSSLSEHFAASKDEQVIRITGDIADRKVQEQILQTVIDRGGS